MIDRRRLITLSRSGLAAMALPRCVLAQVMAKPARILVGFPAGGSIDAVARLIADHMRSDAPSLVVENRPGAGGRIALAALKESPPDGSIMLITPGDQLTLFPHIYAKLSYKPLEDFVPVSTVCTVQFLLTVGPMVPASVKSLADFIGWCRQNPKRATYGSPGAGTRPHFVGVALRDAAGFEFTHLPYKGGADAIKDMLGGHVAANIGTISNTLELVRSGALRALATSAPVRSAALPDVPTLREAGYADAEATEWFGFLVPGGSPPAVIGNLNTAVRAALDSAQVRAGLAKLSLDIRASSSQELAELIRLDTRRSGAIVKASGFKPIE